MNNVTIIGTGPAGLTAAIYTARAGLNPVVYAGMQHGGQLTTTTDVENFPGFAEGIQGPQLMKDMTAQAERVGAKVIYETVESVDFSGKTLKVRTANGEVETKTAIISTGATAKTLNLPHEAELMGKGLSTCATCDGFFYRGKKVLVVGGGDSAMEESLYLANLCKEVHLVHRRDVFKASKIMLERAQKHENITFRVPFTLQATLFDDTGVTGVRLENTETGETSDEQFDGIFYAIGHHPNSDIFKEYVDTDDHGYIKVTNYTETKASGVFAAGDIADPLFKQAITAAGMGCQAAIQAAKYIEDNH